MLLYNKLQITFQILGVIVISSWCNSCGNEKPSGKLNADSFVAANDRLPQLDIRYGNEAGQTMDIYYPMNGDRVAESVMFLVHGGGFGAGDKGDYTEVVKALRLKFRDVMFVNVNYRLATPESPALPKQLDDIGSVLHYLEADSNFHPEKIIFNGASAGAYLSLMYALTRDAEHKITAVIAGSCIFDFNDPEFKKREVAPIMFTSLFGSDSAKWTSELLSQYSIINHVSRSAPEMLITIGEDDELFPAEQVRRMDTLLDQLHIAHESVIYKSEKHNFSQPKNLQHLIITLDGFIANHLLSDVHQN